MSKNMKMLLMTHKVPLAIIAAAIIAASVAQAQSLEKYRKEYRDGIAKIEAYSEANNSLDKAYLTNLDNLIATYKSAANFDAVKALMAEKARFGAEKVMGETITHAKGLQEKYAAGLRQIEAAKAKQSLEFSQRYIASLKNLMIQAMQANKMDEAENINNEVKSIESFIAMLPKAEIPLASNSNLPKTKKQLASKQVVDFFSLTPNVVKEGDLISLQAGYVGRVSYYSKPVVSSALEFGFEIRSKWYHVIGAEIDGLRYLYSRGHWGNTGTQIVEGNGVRNFQNNPSLVVRDAKRFTPMALKIEQGELTWFYDGKIVDKSPLPVTGKHYRIRLLFDSHQTELQIRSLHVSGADIP